MPLVSPIPKTRKTKLAPERAQALARERREYHLYRDWVRNKNTLPLPPERLVYYAFANKGISINNKRNLLTKMLPLIHSSDEGRVQFLGALLEARLGLTQNEKALIFAQLKNHSFLIIGSEIRKRDKGYHKKISKLAAEMQMYEQMVNSNRNKNRPRQRQPPSF